jgi:translation elongation factor EF-G
MKKATPPSSSSFRYRKRANRWAKEQGKMNVSFHHYSCTPSFLRVWSLLHSSQRRVYRALGTKRTLHQVNETRLMWRLVILPRRRLEYGSMLTAIMDLT